jgi:nucleotide-binding universal stress UspA family protein
VGTNGSRSAFAAVRKAAELAKWAGVRLHLVTVYNAGDRGDGVDGGDGVEAATGSPPGPGPERTVRRRAEALLDDLAGAIEAEGIEVRTHALAGEPAPTLVAVAHEERAELIVVGNSGTDKVGPALRAVPSRVSRLAPCSVLIVRDN